MPQSHYEEILSKIHSLQDQLEQELDQLLSKKREKFRYELKKGGLFLIRKFANFISIIVLVFGLTYDSQKYHT